MKPWTRTLILLATGVLVALPAQAQRGGGFNVEERMDRQQGAIERGIDSGMLTRREAKSLQREQREIRHMLGEYRRDGYPPREIRRVLADRLDRAERHIRDLSHNEEVSYRGRDDHRPPPPARDSDRYGDSRHDR